MKNLPLKDWRWLLAFAVGIGIGYLIFGNDHTKHEHAPTETREGKTVWTCSMDPQVRQPNPGKCPICGMDLIPLDNIQDTDLDPDAIRLSASALHLAQVETAIVQSGQVAKTIRLNGKVAADERQIFTQAAHLPGRIERLMVSFTGESVAKGQVIARVYSPELVTAQEELLQAIKFKANAPALYTAAREKLKYWKLSDAQIDALESAGKLQEIFDIQADVSGVVIEKKVNVGDYVMRGDPLFTVANLSKVWVLFEAYESDLPWLKRGDRLRFTVSALPGQTFEGFIGFIDPIINPERRIAQVRLEMANSGNRLKPEMFATAEIQATLSAKAGQIIVPRSAVLWTGKRSIVYVQDPAVAEPTFLLREVTLGLALGDSYVIESGLQAGEQVVVNGTFAIDAAAQLAGKKSMMSAHNDPNQRTTPIAISKNEKQRLAPVVEQYLQMKDALVTSDAKLAQRCAADLVKAIANVPVAVFSGEAADYWAATAPKLSDLSNKIARTDDLAAMRRHFTLLSDRMSNLIKVLDPLEAPIFVQFCPMTNDNKGGYWLSKQSEIRNPYYGDEMLTCGKVVAEIR